MTEATPLTFMAVGDPVTTDDKLHFELHTQQLRMDSRPFIATLTGDVKADFNLFTKLIGQHICELAWMYQNNILVEAQELDTVTAEVADELLELFEFAEMEGFLPGSYGQIIRTWLGSGSTFSGFVKGQDALNDSVFTIVQTLEAGRHTQTIRVSSDEVLTLEQKIAYASKADLTMYEQKNSTFRPSFECMLNFTERGSVYNKNVYARAAQFLDIALRTDIHQCVIDHNA